VTGKKGGPQALLKGASSFPLSSRLMEKRRSAKDGKRKKVSAVQRAARQRATPASTVDLVIDRATEVLGSKEEAMRWLGTPVRGLDFATPISLLATKNRLTRVNDILGRMEHGIW
jgi:putative toxin-antitoxin system antitoxin component (TIGR02293 family)